jgi:hypothetical protein
VTRGVEVDEVEQLLQGLLATTDPYAQPFRADVANRVILALVLGHFAPMQFEAIGAAASSLSEDSCFVAVAGIGGEVEDHWPKRRLSDVERIRFDDYEGYWESALSDTNLLLSTSGRWVILNAEVDDFALAGGDAAFVRHLVAVYPAWPPGAEESTPIEDQGELFARNSGVWESLTASVLTHVQEAPYVFPGRPR